VTDTAIMPHRNRGLLMTLLIIAYTLNFIDRQIAGILAEPIKHDLGLTDSQLGWLGGTAFALFYTVLAIPIARYADRSDRSIVLTVGLALWSLATAVCGFAQSFAQLFLARMSVGIGEAAGVAPAYSLLTDLYPAERRARAMALYSLGIPLGSALGVVFGGLIAAAVDWRMAFITLGIVGLLFAPIYKWGVRDPGHKQRQTETASTAQVFALIARKPTFWLMSFATGIGSLVSYGLAFWIPSFLARSFHLALVDRSLIYGATVLVGGVAGVWLGGVVGDRLKQARPSAYALVPAITYALSLPAFLLAFSSDSVAVSAILFVIPTALSLAWLGPVIGAINGLVPPHMRATASAMYLFITNLIGLGLGTLVIGTISDALTAQYGDEALRYSAMATTLLYVIPAVLMAVAARRLARDSEQPNA
jgi:predicted MFS family arabinose efflux permease